MNEIEVFNAAMKTGLVIKASEKERTRRRFW
jgi:hypothetical protein